MPFRVGFWKTHDKKEILEHMDESFKNTPEYLAAISYIMYSIPILWYRGIAQCRLCNTMLGSRDMRSQDEKWVFPERYEHYLKNHNIRPPAPFIRDAVKWYRKIKEKEDRKKKMPKSVVTRHHG